MNRRPSTTRLTAQASGFTLVEMLVIISIIILLAGIAIPTVLNVRRQIAEKASQVLINTLDAGCKSYKQDWGTYPLAGDETAWERGHLAQDLLGHYGDSGNDGEPSSNSKDDGVAGYGFRKRANGKKVGAYVDPDKVKLKWNNKKKTELLFLDEFDNEVNYKRYGDGGVGDYFKDDNDKPFRRDFFLWTKGADGEKTAYRDDPATDDITNFLP